MRILVTPRSMTAAGLDLLPDLEPLRARGWELVPGPAGRLPTEDELIALLSGIDGWIAGVEAITDRVLSAADTLRVISRNGVGADAVDLDAASRRGIKVQVARGANSRGVAELALALILTALRGIPEASVALHSGEWSRTLGREIPDLTVGIVGWGAIGRLVGGFSLALDARVLAFDPFATVTEQGVRQVELEQLFTQSDVVSLHTPPSVDGRPLVGAELLRLMPIGGILINTARSALVDPNAVLAALESNQLSRYAVDAFDQEPPTLTALLRHHRTLMTPHLGGYTDASTRRATELAVTNLLATLEP